MASPLACLTHDRGDLPASRYNLEASSAGHAGPPAPGARQLGPGGLVARRSAVVGCDRWRALNFASSWVHTLRALIRPRIAAFLSRGTPRVGGKQVLRTEAD